MWVSPLDVGTGDTGVGAVTQERVADLRLRICVWRSRRSATDNAITPAAYERATALHIMEGAYVSHRPRGSGSHESPSVTALGSVMSDALAGQLLLRRGRSAVTAVVTVAGCSQTV